MNNNNISRRDFIRTTAFGAAGVATGAVMLTACEKDTPWYTIPRGAMNVLGAMQYPSMIGEYENDPTIGISKKSERSWVLGSRDRIKEVVEYEEKESGIASGFTWDVDLYGSPQVNAWCMPGARMAFYDGIIPMCGSQSGVAVVMGHEVAHAVRNHAGQRMGMQLGINLGLQAVDYVAKLAFGDAVDPEVIDIAMQVFAVGGNIAALAYSRNHEHEADRMGLMYAAKAGYNPTVAPVFWKNMEDEFGASATPTFLSTHPAHGDRSSRLSNLQQEALEYYENSEFEKVTIKDRIKNLNDSMDEAWEHYKQAIS